MSWLKRASLHAQAAFAGSLMFLYCCLWSSLLCHWCVYPVFTEAPPISVIDVIGAPLIGSHSGWLDSLLSAYYYCYLLVSPFQISLILDSPFCNIFKVTGGEECLSRSIIKWFFRHFPSNFAVFTKSTCIWPNDILLSQTFFQSSNPMLINKDFLIL